MTKPTQFPNDTTCFACKRVIFEQENCFPSADGSFIICEDCEMDEIKKEFLNGSAEDEDF